MLEAYYADAIDVTMLKAGQTRLGGELRTLDESLAALETDAAEWRRVLDVALRFATNCAVAYRSASERTKRQFNTAVFDRLEVRDGRIAEAESKAPFDALFNAPQLQ